jgi:3-isopropylmalate/(R)-2-methylmalate dehydratase large subunit
MYVDVALAQENTLHAFTELEKTGRKVIKPGQIYAFTDHYVPTTGRAKGTDGIPDLGIRNMVIDMQDMAKKYGVTLFGMAHEQQGIMHIVPPEQGIIQPGLFVIGNDSHTSTHGAFGCLAYGVGASEFAHVMATQALWQRKPKAMRVTIDGELGFGVTAKDVILALIAQIGVDGATGHAIEYAGSTIRNLSMATDDGAQFDKEVKLDATQIAPTATWGITPEHALPVTGVVPDPTSIKDAKKRSEYETAIEYMALRPGMALQDIQLDRVFIGSCTNGRIEDLRAAAAVAKHGKAKVMTWVVPGSMSVKRQAEAEGLDQVFIKAGFEWRDPGCSLCTAINGDNLQPGERCASTSNRNFRNRQGPGGRTHLLSPAMAAAAAIKGHLADVREIIK